MTDSLRIVEHCRRLAAAVEQIKDPEAKALAGIRASRAAARQISNAAKRKKPK